MSEFIRGILWGSVGLLVICNILGKVLLYFNVMMYKHTGESRQEVIDRWVLARRKYYERTLPYWEEV